MNQTTQPNWDKRCFIGYILIVCLPIPVGCAVGLLDRAFGPSYSERVEMIRKNCEGLDYDYSFDYRPRMIYNGTTEKALRDFEESRSTWGYIKLLAGVLLPLAFGAFMVWFISWVDSRPQSPRPGSGQ